MADVTETDSRPTPRRRPIYKSLFFQVFIAIVAGIHVEAEPEPAPAPAPAGAQS